MWKESNDGWKQYGQATLNIFKALADVRHGINNDMKTKLVVAWNKDLKFPVQIKNPETNKVNAWKSSYGIPEPPKPDAEYWNKTEKMLTETYTQVFATQEAIDLYESEGVVTDDLFKGVGRAYLLPCEVKRQWRLEKDGYDLETNPWFHGQRYRIKDNIKRWIPNPLTPLVFTAVYKREVE